MPDNLAAQLAELDRRVADEKAQTGDVTLETALAWWNTATAIRDIREQSTRVVH